VSAKGGCIDTIARKKDIAESPTKNALYNLNFNPYFKKRFWERPNNL